MRLFFSILICVMVLMGAIFGWAIMHPQIAIYCLHGLSFVILCVFISAIVYFFIEPN